MALSGRRYLQLWFCEEMKILVSRSGKYDVVSVHVVENFGKGRFEEETGMKKLKETKGCLWFSVCQVKVGDREDIYLCVAMERCILVLKWAVSPFNKFMKVKV